MKAILMVCIIIISTQITQAQNHNMNTTQESEKVVRDFLQVVRSGKAPERAAEFMADTVIAHQMNAEKQEAIKRTPQNYTEHVRDFLTQYGAYTFEVTELIASNNKVYARWEQTGRHMADIDQYKATSLPLTEIGSAVYRVENGKIIEYWIQLDRMGMEIQLQQNKLSSTSPQVNKLPFTAGVVAEKTLYISGQIGTDSTGQLLNANFITEADQVMKNLGSVLKSNNLSYNDLVNVTIYLTTMDDYTATNEVYQKYFNENFPARVCIAVKELPLKARIEIAGIARKKKD